MVGLFSTGEGGAVTTIILTIVVGLITGFSAGMFGIGGALLSTPLLRELVGLPELIALATPLPATLPAAISGSFVYRKEGYLLFGTAFRVLAAALPANIAGAWLVRYVDGPVMMVLTGLVLLYSAILFLKRGAKKPPVPEVGGAVPDEGLTPEGKPVEPVDLEAEARERRQEWYLHAGIGALAGFMSGFLAIGGGMVLVPAFVLLLKMPTKQALATSLFCVAALAIPGTIVHHLGGRIDWTAAGILMITVFPVSALGARAASRMKSRTLELSYGLMTLVFALAFIIRNIVGN